MSYKNNNKSKNLLYMWTILFTITSIVFLTLLIYLDILTTSMIAILSIVVIILTVLFDFILLKRNVKNSHKIIVVVISIIITMCYAVGIYYIGHTLSFLGNITQYNSQITEYNVIVKESSKYKNIKDIENCNVTVYRDNTVQNEEAKKLLKQEVDVNFVSNKNINEICESVINKNNIIFVTESQYENAKERISNYDNETRILYTVKVTTNQKDISKAVDITKHPFNVYVSGIDTSGSITKVSRSDVNMILTVDPIKHKVLMTSIPRDSYVPLQGEGHKGQMDKFTHTGIYGIEETILTAEELLDIDINYYAKVNFTTVKELIDILGGIDINSEKDFRSKYGYHYQQGINHVDGKEALAFARERYAFTNGDFQRNRNQQIVIEGIINKISSSRTILTSYTDILSAIKEYISINMSPSDIKKLVKMQLSNMTNWTIESSTIKGTTGSSTCYSSGGANASVVYPDEESVIEASMKINSYFDN